MPKPRKPSRSRRRRSGRPPLTPRAAPAPPRPVEPSPAFEEEAVAEVEVEEPSTVRGRIASRARARSAEDIVQERSARRQLSEDFGYVQKDLRRIIVLASAIIIAIVVLSFFLP